MDGKPHLLGSGRPAVGRPQRGMALLAATVAVGLFAVVAMLGYSAKTLYDHRLQVDTRAQLLDEGERALLGFLAEHHRLPCPDVDGDGEEDCAPCAGVPEGEECEFESGIPAKGLLPTETVQLDLAGYRPGLVRLGYVVDPRLAEQVQRFRAGRWDYWQGGAMDPGKTFDRPDGVNVLDFCAVLDEVRRDGAGQAFVRDEAGTGNQQVAFGLADPGETLTPAADDSGNRFRGFEGLNADWETAILESPLRAGGAGYDDQVVARGAQALFDALACQDTMASVHAIGQAVEVVAEVQSQKAWTTVLAAVQVAMAGVKAALLFVKAMLALYTLISAGAELVQAATTLAATIAGCVAIVGCAGIAAAIAAVAAASAAVATAAAASVAYAAAVGPMLAAVGLYLSVAIESGASIADAPIDWDKMLNDLKNAIEDAEAQAEDARAKANEARADADEARQRYDDEKETFLDALKEYAPDGISDADVQADLEALTGEYQAWLDAEQAVENAEKRKEGLQREVDQLEEALAQAEEALANSSGDGEGAEVDDDALDQWLDDLENLDPEDSDGDWPTLDYEPGNFHTEESVAEIRRRLEEKRGELSDAEQQIESAKQARDSAKGAYESSRMDFLTKYNLTLNAGALDNYFDAYRKWSSAERVADDLAAEADAADKRVEQQQEQYDTLKEKIGEPGDSVEEIKTWDDADKILNEALKRGVIQ
ncbi:MAG: hypothetical protein ACP5DC_00115 [Halothiobacillaceae bacterium]